MSSITEVRGGATVFTFPVRRSIMPEKTSEYEGILQDICRTCQGYDRVFQDMVWICQDIIWIHPDTRAHKVNTKHATKLFVCVC